MLSVFLSMCMPSDAEGLLFKWLLFLSDAALTVEAVIHAEQQGVQTVICCDTETKLALLVAFKVVSVDHGSTLILDRAVTDEVANRRLTNHYFDG